MRKTSEEIKVALANIANQLDAMAIATREVAQLNDPDEVARSVAEAMTTAGDIRTAYRELLPDGMAKTLLITIAVDGDADAALEAIDRALDAGAVQDAIADTADSVDEFAITSVLATYQ